MIDPVTAIAIGTKVLKALGIKGPTQHMSWDQANQISNTFRDELSNAILKKYGTDMTVKIGRQFAVRTLDWMKNTVRWEPVNQDPGRADAVKAIQGYISRLDHGTDNIIATSWRLTMWILVHVDSDRPETWTETLRYDINHTLGNAIGDLTDGNRVEVIDKSNNFAFNKLNQKVDQDALHITGTPPGGTSTGSSSSSTSGLSTASMASIFQGKNIYVVIGVIVVMIALFYFGRKT